jgi:peptidoglycan/LPS O-acetylase OafA/YrhL
MQRSADLYRQQHLTYLDSARGIAALMVVGFHYINWQHADHAMAKAGSIIFNGSDAVSFFFVLSGFVLSFGVLTNGRPMDVRKYYLARFFRLWPAFFVTVLLNALNWMRNDLSAETLTNTFLLNKTSFWNEAMLIRAYPQYFIPGWTLVIELAISFFVPYMIIVAQRNIKALLLLMLAILLFSGNFGEWFMFNFHFALGVLLSSRYDYISGSEFKNSRWYKQRYFILLCAVILFSSRHIERLLSVSYGFDQMLSYVRITHFHLSAIGSFCFIVFAITSERAQQVLHNRILVFLGKISYGIYLMHWLLVTDIFIYKDRLFELFPNNTTAYIVVLILYFIATIMLATILHYTVELPFMRWGKRLAAKLKPSFTV